ncbi:MAG: hypothetical protein ABI687_06535 [Flavitalea sp.]
MKIDSPVDGDILHTNDGAVKEDGLHTTIKVSATSGSVIFVNGNKLDQSGDLFTGDIVLKQYRNVFEVTDQITKEIETIVIYFLKDLAGKYRLSIDDNIWFLQDLTENANRYQSLFDNDYLAFLKKVNEKYGTKVHLNLFYQVEGFDLSRMTGKFRQEWKDNAYWIKLSFHALQEFPDMPYVNAGYEEVKHDCQLVDAEIRRFAGEEVMGSVTTIHWGEATVEGSRAMRDQGYKAQLGYFNIDDGLPAVSYYLDEEQRRNIKKRFVWKDNREDIVFIKTSIVIDTKKLDDILPHLNRYIDESRMPPYVDLLVHEQYYYPRYHNYQPDYREKILTAVKWADDNGYKPAFLTDCIFDKRKS